jgi:SMI1-KNR4 cell-wall
MFNSKNSLNFEPVIFKDFDFTNFWDDDEYALENYVEECPSDQMINSIEQELGYKLPASYIELIKIHNGGIPKNCCFPTTKKTSWAKDHVMISGIMAMGRIKNYSLCGNMGSQFMIDGWDYPAIGVYICDCPSAGHDMIMLDYSNCKEGEEPKVVHIDQELSYKKTFLAKNFETFIRGLVNEEIYN